jgi:plasmid stabilization system protein ParE
MKYYKIKIEPEVIDDLNEASKWYENQKIGLGKLFKRQFKSEIEILKVYPELFENRYRDFRCMELEKYPYMVHYQIIDSQELVIITSIFHTSRNPDLWLKAENE